MAFENLPNNNGKVGMMGISYDGWTTMMGTLDLTRLEGRFPRKPLRQTCF